MISDSSTRDIDTIHVKHVVGCLFFSPIIPKVLIKEKVSKQTAVLQNFFSRCLTCVISFGQFQDEVVGAGQSCHPEHFLIGGLHPVLDVLSY